jgi:hypothetical protein
MKLTIPLIAFLALFALPAMADVYSASPATSSSMVWDTTTGTLYAIGVAGQPTTTIIPTQGVTNTWTAQQNFTGHVEIGTTVAGLSNLTVVGLGTVAPIGTTTGALYMCVDNKGNTYGKSSCP